MISIQPKLDAIHQALIYIKDETKWLDVDIIKKLGAGVTRKAKQNYRSLFRAPKRGRDGMYSKITKYLDKPRRIITVTNSAANANDGVRYPFVQAHGAVIKAKKEKYLTFQIDGKWIKKQTVTLPVRDWIQRPGNQYMASMQADEDIHKVIDQKISQLKRKGILA